MSRAGKRRRPAPRAGKAAPGKSGRPVARAARGTRKNTLWYVATAVIVIVGVALLVVVRPTKTASAGVKFGEHWHAALGVYACDHWDGGSTWPTPTDATTGSPARADGGGYAGLHSHQDGLIHMEPQSSDDTGNSANIGTYFKENGFQLSATHVKFVTADLNNGDKCANAPGTLHWLVNGKERTGNPANYVLHDHDWVVVAFLPDTKKITSLGKPPSYPNLAKQGPAKT
jgi:hypothetical protein